MNKKIIVIFLILSSCFSLFAYKLTERNIGQFRAITIETNALSLENDTIGDRTYASPNSKSSFEFFLTQGNPIGNDSILMYSFTMYLNVRTKYTYYAVLDGSRLLLKLKNGENLTLKCNETSSIQRGGAWGMFIPMTYDIDQEQIEKIIKSGGIEKMRIEFTDEPRDYFFTNNQLGLFFINGMHQIQESMKNNNFEEGF